MPAPCSSAENNTRNTNGKAIEGERIEILHLTYMFNHTPLINQINTMKKVVLFLISGAIVFTSCVGNPEGQRAETTDSVTEVDAAGTELTVNPSASSIKWLGKKVSGEHYGEVSIKSGTLLVDGGKLTGGNFVVDLNTIDVQDK